jgi:hypothetical protein
MRVQLSTRAIIKSDPDVDEIEIKVTLKEGKITENISPVALEKAVLFWVGDSVPSWLDYVIKNGMKRYGKSPEPIYVDDSIIGEP